MKKFELALSIILLWSTVYGFFAFVVGQANPLSWHVDARFGMAVICFATASGLMVAVKMDKALRGN